MTKKDKKQPEYACLIDKCGKEVSRHRTDRMNFPAFCQLVKIEEKNHGKLTVEFESIPESRA